MTIRLLAGDCQDMTDDEKVGVLVRGIQAYLNGDYDYPRKHRPLSCEHGVAYYEACEACTDAHFEALLREIGDT